MAIDSIGVEVGFAITRDEIRALRRMSSSQFRVAYVTLEEPVAVTVNGRVFAYFVPTAPRSAQAEQAGDGTFSRDPALTEAPAVADSDASTPKARRASAPGRVTSRPRTPETPAATMTQADRDAVLRKVNRSGSER